MCLAGQSQRHHGSSVECIFESDHGRTLGISTSNLDRILHRFRSAVHEYRFLRELTRRDFVHALSQTDVTFVGRDLDAGMPDAIEQVFYGFATFAEAMAHL